MKKVFLFSLLFVCFINLDSAVCALFENAGSSIGLEQIKKQSFGNPTWIDFNNDGFIDMVDPRHDFDPSFYINNGNGTFTNIFSQTGITSGKKIDRHGLVWGDYDNDGNMDLFIVVGTKSEQVEAISQLWKGDGQGNFVNVAETAGVTKGGRSGNWVDYNNDGFLDLFILEETNITLFKNNGNGTFANVTQEAGLEIMGYFLQSSSFADYDNDGDMDLFLGGDRDQLFKNNGDGTFSNAFLSSETKNYQEGQGIAWGDYDNDGDLDLFVARGVSDYYRNIIWNTSKITFANIIFKNESPQGIDFRTNGTTVTFYLRINNSFSGSNIFIGEAKTNPTQNRFTLSAAVGIPYISEQERAFYIWKENDSNLWHLRWSTNANRPNFYGEITSNGDFTEAISLFMPLGTNKKCTLYQNNGDGTFTDATDNTNVGLTGNYYSAVWGDYDNDGDLDLYVVDSGDITGNRPNRLYKNNGNGTFTESAQEENAAGMEAVGRHFGSSWGDYNNDGFLDLFISQGRGWGYPLALGTEILYKNIGNYNNWLKINLTGVLSNRLALGATVTVKTGDKTYFRHLNGGGGGELYSQGYTPIHFGLGSAAVVDSIIIKWPSGLIKKIENIASNQTLKVIEDSTLIFEAENNFTILNDIGTNGKINVIKRYSLDSINSVGLPDLGDEFSINFDVPVSGKYILFLREKTGNFMSKDVYWKRNGYSYKLDNNNIVLTKINSSITGPENINDIMWGLVNTSSIWLESGNHTFTIKMSNMVWGLIDYLEIISVLP